MKRKEELYVLCHKESGEEYSQLRKLIPRDNGYELEIKGEIKSTTFCGLRFGEDFTVEIEEESENITMQILLLDVREAIPNYQSIRFDKDHIFFECKRRS